MGDKRLIAVVGDATSVAGFRPLGFDVRVVERPADARELWPSLISGSHGAVFLTEPVYEAVQDLVAEAAELTTPAVVVIPAPGGRAGMGSMRLSHAIERALGTSLPFGEEEI